jgi:proteasome alpha subunit
MSLGEAVKAAVQALGSVGGEGGAARTIAANQLEVAVLDRRRPGRTFRRVTGAALAALLSNGAPAPEEQEPEPAEPKVPGAGPDKPTASAASADLEGTESGAGKPEE